MKSIDGMMLRSGQEIAKYLEVQDAFRIAEASELRSRVIDMMFGDGAAGGARLPWPGFDGRFEVRPGETTVVTGYKGHGKSEWLSHATIGLMAGGMPGIVISPEFVAETLVIRAIRQLAGNSDPSEAFSSRAIDWLKGRLWVLDHQGLTPWQVVLGVLRYAYDKHGIAWAVCDSLMKFGIAPDDYGRQKEFVDRLQSFSHDSGCHTFLVAHARKGGDSDEEKRRPPSMHDIKGTSELADMVENVLTVWFNKRKAIAASKGLDDFSDEADAMVTVEAQRNFPFIGTIALDHHPSGQFLTRGSIKPIEYV